MNLTEVDTTNNELTNSIVEMTEKARRASQILAGMKTDDKNAILMAMAKALRDHRDDILLANAKDMQLAREKATSPAMLDRLELTTARIHSIASALHKVSQLPDPVSRILKKYIQANGLKINKVRVPLGVIAVIYESRPNVTADVSALCIKTGNALILRGGSDALHSNQAILAALIAGGNQEGLPPDAIQLITSTDRMAVRTLIGLEGKIDLVIPRGGESLIREVATYAKVPVIKHYKGVCHVFVESSADQEMALNICENAKCQRPSTCNSIETVLIQRDIAKNFLPRLNTHLKKKGVELRGDAECVKIIPTMIPATEADWSAEYLDLILSVKIVADINEAISHINRYGSHHSDAIITQSSPAKQQFVEQVDSAAVYVNASTRFTDGEEFGMGAEIGISTDKLHARGPMGLEELTTYKYIILGSGQVRA